ncbi:M20 family metallopeptidase [Robbsia sp. Bb-Pol-6]|uniref:Probable succinyl-diaminopimelate desuccinylase n=1 Tax=Robbsia betulipollinis TaxID=2981849 RepID=A0ABT3ZJX9_9BURK|nr:M20 family metallopeptidase [Robbsia betulipollinis]MCY0386595.1 M20 family metallopeptidase [Robbsia betulipollinis]
MPIVDPVALTQSLVTFNSVNPPGDEEACARFLKTVLDELGFQTVLHRFGARRFNLVATLAGRRGDAANGDANAPLGFTGHLDTVPLGNADWTQDPHGGRIVDGRLYGRGTSDMKAGIASFIAACAPMMDALRDGSGLQLILTGGEETGCDGAKALRAEQPALLKQLGALIVGEPTENRVVIGHKGALWLKAVARGVTAHGAMPQEGVNAIYGAARAITRIQTFEMGEPHPRMGAPTLNVGTVAGGLNINSVPDHAEFSIDMRTVPGIDHACLTTRLHHHIGDVALSPIIDLPSVYSDPEQSWVARMTALAEDLVGPSGPVRTVQYFTDAAVLQPACGYPPTIIVGPGESTMAHKTDEYCRVDRLHQAVSLYGAILADWVQQ